MDIQVRITVFLSREFDRIGLMIGKFAFHLIGADNAGIRHLGLAVGMHPICVVHQTDDFAQFLAGTSQEPRDATLEDIVKQRIDSFQRACWREAGKYPDKRWGHQTMTGHIAKLLDRGGSSVSIMDRGWARSGSGYDPIDYFVCRGLRFPTIFVVSDARAVIPRLISSAKVNAEVAAARWKFSIHVMRRVIHFVERSLVVRLEDMVLNPRSAMQEVCAFLDVPYVDETTKYLSDPVYIKSFRAHNLPETELHNRAVATEWFKGVEDDLRLLGYIEDK